MKYLIRLLRSESLEVYTEASLQTTVCIYNIQGKYDECRRDVVRLAYKVIVKKKKN